MYQVRPSSIDIQSLVQQHGNMATGRELEGGRFNPLTMMDSRGLPASDNNSGSAVCH